MKYFKKEAWNKSVLFINGFSVYPEWNVVSVMNKKKFVVLSILRNTFSVECKCHYNLYQFQAEIEFPKNSFAHF